MHISIVSQFYPVFNATSTGGGIEAHNYNFARACERLGERVTVISVRLSKTVPFQQQSGNITVFRLISPNLYRFRRLPLIGRQYRVVQAIIYSYLVCRLLGRIHRENPVDIAEFSDINAEAFWWHKSLSKKLAIRCHAPNFVLSRYYTGAEVTYDTRLLSWAEKHTLRKANILIAPSHSMRTLIIDGSQVAPARIHVVPNAVDIADAYNPVSSDGTVNVLFVGRLERLKGIETLIKAIPAILSHPAIRLTIVGPDRKNAQGMLHKHIIESRFSEEINKGRIELTGALYGAELEAKYRLASVCLVLSLYESFSYTAAQAMIRGLPVIASRVGGIPEVLNNGQCGVLIEPSDPQALAEAVLELAQDPAKRLQLGKVAREYAIANFNSDIVAQRVLALYKSSIE